MQIGFKHSKKKKGEEDADWFHGEQNKCVTHAHVIDSDERILVYRRFVQLKMEIVL